MRRLGPLRLSTCALAALAVIVAARVGWCDNIDFVSHQLWDVETVSAEVVAGEDHRLLMPLVEVTPAEDDDSLPPPDFVDDGIVTSGWSWQWLPAGLIYRSYMAGVHEPRMAIVAFHEASGRTLWDAALGGRVGLVRYGDCNPQRPQGFQLDFYGAAITRLDVENSQDQDSTDYVFGFPLTYGVGNTQYKFGYAHISSHLGDELAIREPETLENRINYVRDAIVFGVSHYVYPVWRVYGEAGWAFHNGGGSGPWEGQFGMELSRPGPTGRVGTPFLAINSRMREEHDFGGDMNVQVGMLRRGEYGQTLRFGAQYYNGKSSQMQFFDQSEEQIGLGLWYDF